MIDDKTRELNLERAELPGKRAMKLHPIYKGKIEIVPKCPISSFDDFAVWYTPGVAEPCLAIKSEPDSVFDYTNKGNSIAIISDGSRVLGLGDIGPKAGLPVMEGKSLLFKYLGGVDAVPIMLDTKDKDEIVRTCKILAPSFGGINLEDIESPKCFAILDELRDSLGIPVWHDDQQGTAAVVLAGLINSAKIVGKKLSDMRITLVGSGAANVVLIRLLRMEGVDPRMMIVVDSKGIINRRRGDLESDPVKWPLALDTNEEQRGGTIEESLKDSDACVALSRSGPGVIKTEWIARMADNAIVFACANPIPEIWPWEAKEGGAKIVATGRSDLPNQANNSLGFPGIFRGALDVRATTITDGMCIAASHELASVARDGNFNEERILPTMEEEDLYPRESVAVGIKAIEEKVATIHKSREELFSTASSVIKRARNLHKSMLSSGFIQPPPP